MSLKEEEKEKGKDETDNGPVIKLDLRKNY